MSRVGNLERTASWPRPFYFLVILIAKRTRRECNQIPRFVASRKAKRFT